MKKSLELGEQVDQQLTNETSSAVSIDSMRLAEEDTKDRNFITALAREIEVLRRFAPDASVLGNQESRSIACSESVPAEIA
jgi:hypothetical protein